MKELNMYIPIRDETNMVEAFEIPLLILFQIYRVFMIKNWKELTKKKSLKII